MIADEQTLVADYLPKQGVIAEVGVFHGDNSRRLLNGTSPRELHLIDRDFSILRREGLEAAISNRTVVLHEGDSSTMLMSFPDRYFDCIYIDANPTYEGVKRDVGAAKKKLKDDGLLVVRNYMFMNHNALFPVGFVHVVNELCVEEAWSLRYFALHSRMYCTVALSQIGPDNGA